MIIGWAYLWGLIAAGVGMGLYTLYDYAEELEKTGKVTDIGMAIGAWFVVTAFWPLAANLAEARELREAR